MFSAIFLGLMMGMRHAIEADHVAALASLMARDVPRRGLWKLGTLWGSGHAVTLFGVGLFFLAFDWAAPEQFSGWLELVVGFMLVALGLDLIRRMVMDRIHFHTHDHGDRVRHFHAHSHADDTLERTANRAHDPAQHPHRHGARLSLRAFVIGMVHGMAGSAALVLVVLGSIQSFWLGVVYMILFGVGSVVGMALFSAVISLPIRLSARSMTWAFNGLQGGIGVWTLVIGVSLITDHATILIG